MSFPVTKRQTSGVQSRELVCIPWGLFWYPHGTPNNKERMGRHLGFQAVIFGTSGHSRSAVNQNNYFFSEVVVPQSSRVLNMTEKSVLIEQRLKFLEENTTITIFISILYTSICIIAKKTLKHQRVCWQHHKNLRLYGWPSHVCWFTKQ